MKPERLDIDPQTREEFLDIGCELSLEALRTSVKLKLAARLRILRQ